MMVQRSLLLIQFVQCINFEGIGRPYAGSGCPWVRCCTDNLIFWAEKLDIYQSTYSFSDYQLKALCDEKCADESILCISNCNEDLICIRDCIEEQAQCSDGKVFYSHRNPTRITATWNILKSVHADPHVQRAVTNVQIQFASVKTIGIVVQI